jgi:hypothetical protein
MQRPIGGDVRRSGHFHPATYAVDPALELPGGWVHMWVERPTNYINHCALLM